MPRPAGGGARRGGGRVWGGGGGAGRGGGRGPAQGLGDAAAGLSELEEDLGFLGIPEVQAIGDAEGDGAGTGHIAGRLGDGSLAALVRVESDVALVAVHREGQAELLTGDEENACVSS